MAGMTEDQAYRTMFLFLEERYLRLPSDGLGTLLGELRILEDGGPADPAIKEEWQRALSMAKAVG
jgi:hypothetical protein